jgi:PEP-CTERM motif-containing protein
MKKVVVSAVAALGLAVVHVSPVSADLIFSLNVDGCTGGCGSVGIPPFGSITLHQVDANTVRVTESLVSGVEFVHTGAGDAIVFNTDKAVSLSNISSGFSQDMSAPPIHVGSFGNFLYGILCSGCGNGASGPLPGPLTFTAADGGTLSVTDFVANAGGWYFAADLVNLNAVGAPTGNVGAGAPSTSVPEPTMLALFGTGLLVLAVGRRRKAR